MVGSMCESSYIAVYVESSSGNCGGRDSIGLVIQRQYFQLSTLWFVSQIPGHHAMTSTQHVGLAMARGLGACIAAKRHQFLSLEMAVEVGVAYPSSKLC
jgi:hypothetical protein